MKGMTNDEYISDMGKLNSVLFEFTNRQNSIHSVSKWSHTTSDSKSDHHMEEILKFELSLYNKGYKGTSWLYGWLDELEKIAVNSKTIDHPEKLEYLNRRSAAETAFDSISNDFVKTEISNIYNKLQKHYREHSVEHVYLKNVEHVQKYKKLILDAFKSYSREYVNWSMSVSLNDVFSCSYKRIEKKLIKEQQL